MGNQQEQQKNRCIRCRRPANGRIGPVCKIIILSEMLDEARAVGFDGEIHGGGIQILFRFDQPLPK